MEIGIITDIHNNIMALKGILKIFKKRNIDYIICAGDIIGIGPWPEETVTRVRSIENLLVCVQGNHDRYLTEGLKNARDMYKDEYEYHIWEHSRLSNESKMFLKSLPLDRLIEIQGRRIYIAHYWMDENMNYFNYIQNPNYSDLEKNFSQQDADIIIYGHNHKACYLEKRGKHFIDVGSLGCPEKDGIGRGGILKIENDKISFESLEFQYDIQKVVEDIRKLNYPAMKEILKYFYGVIL